MRKLTEKLHDARGETLVEVLASVLICSLAVLLLLSYTTAATRIDKSTQDHDVAYYAALNAAEAHTGVTAEDSADPADPPALGASVSGEVTVSAAYPAVNTVTVDVEYFGGDGVYSYAASSPAPTPDEGGGTP